MTPAPCAETAHPCQNPLQATPRHRRASRESHQRRDRTKENRHPGAKGPRFDRRARASRPNCKSDNRTARAAREQGARASPISSRRVDDNTRVPQRPAPRPHRRLRRRRSTSARSRRPARQPPEPSRSTRRPAAWLFETGAGTCRGTFSFSLCDAPQPSYAAGAAFPDQSARTIGRPAGSR